jgi:hypothetical protein
MQSDTNLWHPSNSTKAGNSRDVGNCKDPSSNRSASFKQVKPAGEVTTPTAKMPATAGSVCQSYKSSRKGIQKCDCEYECGSDKKNFWLP